MAKPITLTLLGKPAGKARPRMTRGGVTYTPKGTVNAEAAWRLTAQTEGVGPLDGPLTLTFAAIFEPPRSWPKKRKQAALVGEVKPEGRPDLDNLIKLATDGLNGVAYRDDAQIVSVTANKRYGPQAMTVVTIRSAS